MYNCIECMFDVVLLLGYIYIGSDTKIREVSVQSYPVRHQSYTVIWAKIDFKDATWYQDFFFFEKVVCTSGEQSKGLSIQKMRTRKP